MPLMDSKHATPALSALKTLYFVVSIDVDFDEISRSTLKVFMNLPTSAFISNIFRLYEMRFHAAFIQARAQTFT